MSVETGLIVTFMSHIIRRDLIMKQTKDWIIATLHDPVPKISKTLLWLFHNEKNRKLFSENKNLVFFNSLLGCKQATLHKWHQHIAISAANWWHIGTANSFVCRHSEKCSYRSEKGTRTALKFCVLAKRGSYLKMDFSVNKSVRKWCSIRLF